VRRQPVLSGYFGVNARRDATITAESGCACNVARVEIVSRSVIRIFPRAYAVASKADYDLSASAFATQISLNVYHRR